MTVFVSIFVMNNLKFVIIYKYIYAQFLKKNQKHLFLRLE